MPEIRELTASDLPFLKKMLVTALFWRGGWRWWPSFIVLRSPDVVVFHRDWGRPGDVGYVAWDGRKRLGCAWYRMFTADNHGEGYVDETMPELVIALVKGARGRGLGRRLMETLHERARRDGLPGISLSVNHDNPAKRLYHSFGYVDYEPEDGLERMVLRFSEAGIEASN